MHFAQPGLGRLGFFEKRIVSEIRIRQVVEDNAKHGVPICPHACPANCRQCGFPCVVKRRAVQQLSFRRARPCKLQGCSGIIRRYIHTCSGRQLATFGDKIRPGSQLREHLNLVHVVSPSHRQPKIAPSRRMCRPIHRIVDVASILRRFFKHSIESPLLFRCHPLHRNFAHTPCAMICASPVIRIRSLIDDTFVDGLLKVTKERPSVVLPVLDGISVPPALALQNFIPKLNAVSI